MRMSAVLRLEEGDVRRELRRDCKERRNVGLRCELAKGC